MYRKKEHGFTLVELMVVIVLIGLFAGVVGVAVVPIIFKGKKTVAMNQMMEIRDALKFYYTAKGGYPDTLQELTQPVDEWEDGIMPDVPVDPWGEEYVYQRDGRHITLYSKGEDKLDGTDDDINLDQAKQQDQ